jgi:hypothetical protein
MSLDPTLMPRPGGVRAAGAFLLFVLAALGSASAGRAQSCILTRLDSPVLNAFDSEFNPGEERWQVSFGWRYGYSFRHFRGSDEQEQRLEEHSQVVNNVNLLDFSLRYNFNARTSLTLGIPYLMATRSGALRDENREVVRRYQRSSNRGIGDMTLVAHRYLWDPTTHRHANLSLGGGLKLPTGENMQQENRIELVDGEEVVTTGTADFSVQPGDGAFGFVLDVSGFSVLNQTGSLAVYGSGVYIFEPEATNGVIRPDADPREEEVSASDQYVARLGLQYGPSTWKGWSGGLGWRIEGVPVHDVFGSSTGRRRPGYMMSIEPSVSWTRRAHSVSLAVPWAFERNRQRSVSDIFLGDEGGDAAFPDYIVLLNYAVRF